MCTKSPSWLAKALLLGLPQSYTKIQSQGGGYSRFQVTGIIKSRQKSKTKKSVALPPNPKNFWTKFTPWKLHAVEISKPENSLQ